MLDSQLRRLASLGPDGAAFDLWVMTSAHRPVRVLEGGGGYADACYGIAVGDFANADEALAPFPDCVNADSLYVFENESAAAGLVSIMAEYPALWSGFPVVWEE